MPEHQLIEINENIAKRNIFSVEEFSEWTHLCINQFIKSMRTFLVFIVISFVVSSCTWLKEHEYEGDYSDYDYPSSKMSNGIPSEPGKCYARCLAQDQYESDSIYILEYSGLNPTEILGVVYKTVTTAPASTK